MRISAKLFVGILCVVAVTGALGAYSVVSVAGMGRVAIDLYEKLLLAISLKSAQTHFAQIDAAVNAGHRRRRRTTAIGALQEEFLEEIELAQERALVGRNPGRAANAHEQAVAWVAMNRQGLWWAAATKRRATRWAKQLAKRPLRHRRDRDRRGLCLPAGRRRGRRQPDHHPDRRGDRQSGAGLGHRDGPVARHRAPAERRDFGPRGPVRRRHQRGHRRPSNDEVGKLGRIVQTSRPS